MSPPTTKRSCPDCGSSMQAFHAGQVELDRCLFCRGLWFDGGELDAVLGRPIRLEPRQGRSARKCASCKSPLSPAVLQGHLVESCGGCRGIYLDKGELQSINGGKVRIPQQPQGVTFGCTCCGGNFPLDSGTLVEGGLACSGCATGLPAATQTLPADTGAELESVSEWLKQLGL